MKQLTENNRELLPILSENVYKTDTRFGTASDFAAQTAKICKRQPLTSIVEAETISSDNRLDGLIICPCTGNTLAKIANGITDTSVTMAVKAHIRNRGWVVVALATNDALSSSFLNIARLYDRKCFFFVPLRQDSYTGKPSSLVCDFSKVTDTVEAACTGRQLQPFLIQ